MWKGSPECAVVTWVGKWRHASPIRFRLRFLRSPSSWGISADRCDIHSTGALAAQHMTRTGAGALDNSSAVTGRSLDECARKAIHKAVNDICNSVGNPDPDGDPATDDATPCMPLVAPPKRGIHMRGAARLGGKQVQGAAASVRVSCERRRLAG